VPRRLNMGKRLEDVLDIRAHCEECARRLVTSPTPITLEGVEEDIKWHVPEFLLRDEANQKIWADVVSAHTGLDAEALLRIYRDYLARELAREEELRLAPEVARVFWRESWSDDQFSRDEECTDPVRLSWLCASLEEGGASEVAFRVYGRGRVIKGQSTGWWVACPCGRWLCARHGVPRRRKPSWTDLIFGDPALWPVVPVVRGAMKWHKAPPPP